MLMSLSRSFVLFHGMTCWPILDALDTLKVPRSKPNTWNKWMNEINIMSLMFSDSMYFFLFFISSYDSFRYEDHYCIVQELLGSSLYEYLKANDYQPYPLAHVQSMLKQVFWLVISLISLALGVSSVFRFDFLVSYRLEVGEHSPCQWWLLYEYGCSFASLSTSYE